MYHHIREGIIEIEKSLTQADIHTLKSMSELHMIQFNQPLNAHTYQSLNDLLFAERSDIVLRAYGFYDHVCDLSFLQSLPHITKFHLECTGEITHLECIALLPQLIELNLLCESIDSFDILEDISVHLQSLTLGSTLSKKPDLNVLSRFDQLTYLWIDGHHKHIEVIGQLVTLEELVLQSISVPHLDFLQDLKSLWSLHIHFGGTRHLDVLADLQHLQYLRLSQIKGLEDIDFISSMQGLQYLYLEALPHIKKLPLLSDLQKLRKIELIGMKGLKDITALEHAPALIEFIHREAWEMQAEDYEPLMKNPSLQRAYAHLKNAKKMSVFQQLLQQYDKKNTLEERDQHHENWWFEFPYQHEPK